jgi:hypothetical protein
MQPITSRSTILGLWWYEPGATAAHHGQNARLAVTGPLLSGFLSLAQATPTLGRPRLAPFALAHAISLHSPGRIRREQCSAIRRDESQLGRAGAALTFTFRGGGGGVRSSPISSKRLITICGILRYLSGSQNRAEIWIVQALIVTIILTWPGASPLSSRSSVMASIVRFLLARRLLKNVGFRAGLAVRGGRNAAKAVERRV